jgi:hypothetical protein
MVLPRCIHLLACLKMKLLDLGQKVQPFLTLERGYAEVIIVEMIPIMIRVRSNDMVALFDHSN